MVCIYCGHDTRVVNSRTLKRGNGVWRRRQCQTCRAIFSTHEEVTSERALSIRKRKHLEPFQRDKLFLSVYDSLRHRKTAQVDATALTNTIVGRLNRHIQDAAIDRQAVISEVSGVLKRFDKAAYSAYQAYHPAD